jgi:hypothetical protein
VRVKRRTGPRPVEKNAPVVILSRRALERLRPAALVLSVPVKAQFHTPVESSGPTLAAARAEMR